jgi:hypothetical protein
MSLLCFCWSNSYSPSLFSNRMPSRPRTRFGPLGRDLIGVSGSGSCTMVVERGDVALNRGCKTSGLGFWQADAKIGVSMRFLFSTYLSNLSNWGAIKNP